MISELIRQLKTAPEYFFALKGALAVLASGLPIYAGIRYFMYKRRLSMPLHFHLAYMSSFILFSGLAFLYASPLASLLPSWVINIYLIVTCILTAYGIVMLADMFLVQHYLSTVRRLYVSPPMRTILRLLTFVVVFLPILQYVMHFNPLALVAIPTIATAGLALALQDTLKTFIAGVGLGNILRLGDWIGFQDKIGQVCDINWARTILRTSDGNHIYIPNSQLQTGLFTNFSAINQSYRISLKIGVSYDATPAKVKTVLLQCVKEVPGIAETPEPAAYLQEYGDSGMLYTLYGWVSDYSKILSVQDEVSSRIWTAFRREGIEIPYPIRTVNLRRPGQKDPKKIEHIQQTLQQWRLAEAFYVEELNELSQWAVSRSYGAGENIVKQGDTGQSLFVLAEGEVDVMKEERPQEPLTVLRQGNMFGEMSLLTGEPRSATVRARGQVEVLEIHKTGLQKVIARRPELSEKLAQLVTQRQAMTASPNAGASSASEENKADEKSLAGRIRHFFGL